MKGIILIGFFITILSLFNGCDNGSIESLEAGGPTSCRPECMQVDTTDEGWYYNCDASPIDIGTADCFGVLALCKYIGTRSEGWYESTTDSLIEWDNCSD